MQEMPTLTMNLSGIMGDVGSALKLVDTKTATNLILTVEVHFILSVSLTIQIQQKYTIPEIQKKKIILNSPPALKYEHVTLVEMIRALGIS